MALGVILTAGQSLAPRTPESPNNKIPSWSSSFVRPGYMSPEVRYCVTTNPFWRTSCHMRCPYHWAIWVHSDFFHIHRPTVRRGDSKFLQFGVLCVEGFAKFMFFLHSERYLMHTDVSFTCIKFLKWAKNLLVGKNLPISNTGFSCLCESPHSYPPISIISTWSGSQHGKESVFIKRAPSLVSRQEWTNNYSLMPWWTRAGSD